MKRNLFISIAILSLLTTGCGRKTELRKMTMDESLFKTVTLNPDELNTRQRYKLSEIATRIEYIPLETSDSILVGGVNKLIVWNDRYYVWDRITESIFCFDSNGKYQHRLNKRGEGPEEYAQIFAFDMDRNNGDYCIYSNSSQSVLVYSENGQIKSHERIPFLFNTMAKRDSVIHYYSGRLPNRNFYEASFPEQYRLLTVGTGLKVLNEQLPYSFDASHLEVALPGSNFTYYKDTLLLTEYWPPKVYTVLPDGNLSPRYRFEFTTNTYTPSYDAPIDSKAIQQVASDGGYTSLGGPVHETDHYLFFNYVRGLIGMAYVDKSTHEIHNMGYFLEDNLNHLPMATGISTIDNGHLYKVTEPASLLRNKKVGGFSKHLSEVMNRIEETDNPIIIKITLK